MQPTSTPNWTAAGSHRGVFVSCFRTLFNGKPQASVFSEARSRLRLAVKRYLANTEINKTSETWRCPANTQPTSPNPTVQRCGHLNNSLVVGAGSLRSISGRSCETATGLAGLSTAKTDGCDRRNCRNRPQELLPFAISYHACELQQSDNPAANRRVADRSTTVNA